ncbi:cobalamin B12-binding domain-containing protein [Peribacillus kribbensis]|uniref:cobalamin B12-binding domain-containing protein n=1 Tax=Peribacillus kribbensis TaxID=356658 RepID=UPI00040B7B1E|nr:cobalamin-dependent protein [Peribacillus kribbensis]
MREIYKSFAEALLKGDQEDALNIVKKVHYYNRAEAFLDIFTPAMRYIGDLWENNDISVADEHLATAVCDFVLSRLYPAKSSSSQAMLNKRAMFLCLEGEQHYLGLKMVSSLFEEAGWNTRYLGPNLPLEYALKHAAAWQPDVIGLSVTIVYHLPLLKTYVKELSKLSFKPEIFVGGRLVGTYDLLPYCKEAVLVKDLNELYKIIGQKEHGEKLDALL